jgi:hypothetical protein
VVSAVIVVERTEEGHTLPVQRPVYYISEVLSETKARYPQVQKLLYAVVLARRKLRHYFEAHPVTVVSSFPLGEIICNPDAAGKIAKWSVELMGETLAYALKSQILVDFVAEWTDTQLPPPQIQAECWTLYFDGSVMKADAGAGLLFFSPLGEHMRYATGQTGGDDRSDRCTTEPRNGSKPPENLLNASNKPFQAQTSPSCWQCMNQAKNAKLST